MQNFRHINSISHTKGHRTPFAMLGASEGYNAQEVDTGTWTIPNTNPAGGTFSMVNFTGDPVVAGSRPGTYGIEFDGTNDHLSVTPTGLDNTVAGQSISLIAIPDAVGANMGLFGYTNGATQRCLLRGNTSGVLFFELSGTTASRRYTGTTTLVAGTAYHICLVIHDTFDFASAPTASDVTIYINGQVESVTTAVVGGSAIVCSTFNIGRVGPAGQYFDGVIQDPRLYKKALSAAEVQRLFSR